MSHISRTSSCLVKNICMREVPGVGITREKKYGFIGKILNLHNDVITISFNNKKAKFERKEIFSLIDNAVGACNKKTKEGWVNEETRSILSSEVNKVIDAACSKYGYAINEKEKDGVFRKVSSGLGALKLDPRCTQSSISQALYNNKGISDRVDKLYGCSESISEKNKFRNMVNYKLANYVFMEKFGGADLDIIRDNAAQKIALIMKRKCSSV